MTVSVGSKGNYNVVVMIVHAMMYFKMNIQIRNPYCEFSDFIKLLQFDVENLKYFSFIGKWNYAYRKQ